MKEYNEIMSIADAAKYLGVSIDSVRRWEKKGYIKSFRTPGNHRRYNKKDLNRIKNG